LVNTLPSLLSASAWGLCYTDRSVRLERPGCEEEPMRVLAAEDDGLSYTPGGS